MGFLNEDGGGGGKEGKNREIGGSERKEINLG